MCENGASFLCDLTQSTGVSPQPTIEKGDIYIFDSTNVSYNDFVSQRLHDIKIKIRMKVMFFAMI
jgi:hypothetical protein